MSLNQRKTKAILNEEEKKNDIFEDQKEKKEKQKRGAK